MRLYDIIKEDTKSNLDIVSKLADIVVGSLPIRIQIGKSIVRTLKDIEGFNAFVNDLPDHLKKFSDVLSDLSHSDVVFLTTNEGTYQTWLGIDSNNNASALYVPDTKDVIVRLNMVQFLNSYIFDKDGVRYIDLAPNSMKNWIKIRLVHEFRHYFQHMSYPGYFNSDKQNAIHYKKRPDEVDAVWTQALANFAPNAHTSVNEFTKSVMNYLTSQKQLTQRQKDHYAWKTKRYWYDHFDTDHHKSANAFRQDLNTREIESLMDTFKQSLTEIDPEGKTKADYANAVINLMDQKEGEIFELLYPEVKQKFLIFAMNHYDRVKR